jgi:hypothetical protein
MANVSQYGQVGLLNYINQGSTTNLPVAHPFLALCTGSPTSLGGSQGELGTAEGYSRQTCTWANAAGTPASATNLNAMTFGAFSSVRTLSGILQYDLFQTATLGNELWFGLLATPRVVITGDTLVIAAGALTSQIN